MEWDGMGWVGDGSEEHRGKFGGPDQGQFSPSKSRRVQFASKKSTRFTFSWRQTWSAMFFASVSFPCAPIPEISVSEVMTHRDSHYEHEIKNFLECEKIADGNDLHLILLKWKEEKEINTMSDLIIIPKPHLKKLQRCSRTWQTFCKNSNADTICVQARKKFLIIPSFFHVNMKIYFLDASLDWDIGVLLQHYIIELCPKMPQADKERLKMILYDELASKMGTIPEQDWLNSDWLSCPRCSFACKKQPLGRLRFGSRLAQDLLQKTGGVVTVFPLTMHSARPCLFEMPLLGPRHPNLSSFQLCKCNTNNNGSQVMRNEFHHSVKLSS